MHLATDTDRFNTPMRKSRCGKLVVNGEVVSDPEVLLDVWVKHFSELAKLRQDEMPGMAELQRKVQGLALESMGNEDMLLDVSFLAEVLAVVSKLKCGKAAGPAGFMAEHLKAGGEVVVIWLLNVLNTIVKLEVIKRGVVVPVYKGSGNDPLWVDSYQGVTLSCMVAKVLEFLSSEA